MTDHDQNHAFDHTLTEGFRAETLADLVNSVFVVEPDQDQSCELELIEVKLLKHHDGAPRKDPFSLLFRGPREVMLQQCTYNLRHETLGTFPLFLVPLLPDSSGNYFEAIFN